MTNWNRDERAALFETFWDDDDTEGLYDEGRKIFGAHGDVMVNRLVEAKNGCRAYALVTLLHASKQRDPRKYVEMIIRGNPDVIETRAIAKKQGR
jgi:hypothetical protein